MSQKALASIPSDITSNFIEVGETKIHYLSVGTGDAILMIHGWPTSSCLWRNVMLPLAKNKQVIAIDLPGLGKSSKSLKVSYSFNYYEKIISQFLNQLKIEKVNLVVHDLGGPVGLMWAVRNPDKVSSLVLLNTLVYPEMSWAVKLFMLMTFLPGVRNWLSSKSGIIWAMRLGVFNKQNLTPEILENYYLPFEAENSRKALLKSVQRLSPKGFSTIAEKLPEFNVPVRLIYGENDKILPDIAKTMERVKQDLPQAELFSIPNCGHFLQEDEPEKVAELMSEFYDAR
jgi:pimeloyl-ACP methyl ester carboxylesterase